MALPASDALNVANGVSLVGRTGWTVNLGGFTGQDTRIWGAASGASIASWTGDAFNANGHESRMVVDHENYQSAGPAVLVSGTGTATTCYAVLASSSGTALYKRVSNAWSQIGAALPAHTSGVEIRLRFTRTGGQVDFEIFYGAVSQGTRSDSSSPLTSGSAGGAADSDQTEIVFLRNFYADDVAGGAAQALEGAAAGAGAATGALQALGTRYARPLSDVSAGLWTPSSGGVLAPMLDEAAADDGDYIRAQQASTCEIALRGVLDPASSSGHVIRWRSPAGYTPSGGLVVSLMQGATLIAQWTTNPVAAGTTYEHTLSGAEADAITNYDDLRLRLQATS
jgi:hypothetical protein